MKEALKREALALHEQYKGKLSVEASIPVKGIEELSLVYSPGVAAPCLEIQQNVTKAYTYTMKGNLVGVVSDGTAVLGLGDIGPEAAMPVMEGKALLLKQFAGINAVPICLDTKDTDEIVQIVRALAPTFGAINLEDISAPRCFEIEARLQDLGIPVFHDDQHGTAIVVGAGLINALKIVGKQKEQVRVVINGAGAAGVAILKILLSLGYQGSNIVVCDSKGIIYEGRKEGMNSEKEYVALWSNTANLTGSLEEAVVNTDIFIGVSAPNVLTEKMISTMNVDPIIFALANPDPEVTYENALAWGAKVIATGRSDYPNQINNMLAFPGIFRGALDVHATAITEEMKLATIEAIANLVTSDQLVEGTVVPNVFEIDVTEAVAHAVRHCAYETGIAKTKIPVFTK
ncbi:malate dehydrogenase [Kurthia sp. 3B1D]|uniref:Malate dehydrogenase n=1 Tax=Candidatus Kurthia intestinigallinarum TaxID=1562256 RepID=A0A433RY73_9BACL|nr:malic enzyme-like NAD(P)-binding protein [Kurthia sp. 3B1D]RUS58222.1 malate dehydrogenase [Kurthia sp. 3B1D]